MILVFAALLASGVLVQDTALELAPRPLKSSGAHVLDVPLFGDYGQPKCDDNLASYHHLATGSFRRTVILRVSQSGEEGTLYKLPDDLAESTSFVDFSVTPNGDVRALVQDQFHVSTIDFDSNGNVKRHAILEAPENMGADHIAVFPDGTALFSGHFRRSAPADLAGKRYVGLFQASGKLLRRLDHVSDDIRMEEAHEDRFADGGATIGKDGNVYLLTSDRVLVISSSGQVQRKVSFEKPGTEFSAVRVQYSEGLLAVSFAKPGKPAVIYRYLVMNASDGVPIGLYEPTEETGNDNVCFSRHDGFLFFTVKDGKINLVTAPLR